MATANLVQFAGKLYADHIISYSVMEEANLQLHTPSRVSSILMSAIISKVKAKPKLLKRFVSVLKEEGSDIFDKMAGKLETALEKIMLES